MRCRVACILSGVAIALTFIALFSILSSGAYASHSFDDDDMETFTISYGDYGLVYLVDTDTSVIIVSYTGVPINVDAPGEVTHGGKTYTVTGISRAFQNCNTIETFRGGFEGIKFDVYEFSFYGCMSLKSVTLGPKTWHIHDWAFMECVSLERYDLPEGSLDGRFTTIDGVLFVNGDSLYKYPSNRPGNTYAIPEGVIRLISRSFDYAFQLRSVYIHADVDYIFPGAFHECVNMEEFILDPRNCTFNVVNGVLYEEDMRILVSYPAGKPGPTFIMPDSVRDVADQAFFGNRYLEEITFSKNLEAVNFEAFNSSRSLKRVTLPEGCKYIGDNCFSMCGSLEYVSFPSTISVFGYYLFRACVNLDTVLNASNVPMDSLMFVEEARTFYYYKDPSHTIPHENPKEMYGDIYYVQPGSPEPPDDPTEEHEYDLHLILCMVSMTVMAIVALAWARRGP